MMSALVWILTFLSSGFLMVYWWILVKTRDNFRKKNNSVQTENHALSKISVVIAARNEEEHIVRTLHSVLYANECDLLQEIIVVDDHSDDNTREKIAQLNHPLIRCVSLPEGQTGKKAALTRGIHLAYSDIIAVTDADCVVGKNWPETIASAYANDNQLVMTTGLVLPDSTRTILDRFQWLDFAATMAMTNLGITTKKYYLANGANMSFRKSAFQEIGGYRDNVQVASGDDVFLIKKMAALPNKNIRFINDLSAAVTTKPETSWENFWRQRKRWATKSTAYASSTILGIQSLAFLLAFSIPVYLLLALYVNPLFLIPATFVFFGKCVIDYFFLSGLSKILQKKDAMKNFMTSYLLYQRYIIIMGFFALLPTKTDWKGRKI